MRFGRIIPGKDDLYRMVANELFAPSDSDRIGLELEMATSRHVGGEVRSVPLHRDMHGAGLLDLLGEIALDLDGIPDLDDPARLSVGFQNGGRITLEPAGQIEYSGPPLATVRGALDDLRRVTDAVARRGDRMGIEFDTSGFNRNFNPERFGLVVAKPRYRAMEEHFSAIGPFGQRMMRATCALQINLDFGSGIEAQERWRLANMISPSLNALFANSPWHCNGDDYRSFRGEIWRRADPSRTGRLFDCPDLDPVADYLRFALDATVMMIEREGRMYRPSSPMTYRGWLDEGSEHGRPDWSDWRLHLSTLFPDVRARGWMELRSIDALGEELREVAVALATTLLYNRRVRHRALERLENRPRSISADDHEHGGYWSSDLATGFELLALACEAFDDPQIRARAADFARRGLSTVKLDRSTLSTNL